MLYLYIIINSNKMSTINKRQYEARANSAANRMAENAKNNSLTLEQHEVIASLCSYRHNMHSSMDSICKNDENGQKNELIRINSLLNEVGLTPMDFCGISIGEDYIDIDDIQEAIFFAKEDGDYINEDEYPQEYQDWYDDTYNSIIVKLEILNKNIEKYLSEIDEKYKTSYCPTRALRIF